jgi:hypothetical protein
LIGLFHQVVIEELLICVEQIDEIDEPNDIGIPRGISHSRNEVVRRNVSR